MKVVCTSLQSRVWCRKSSQPLRVMEVSVTFRTQAASVLESLATTVFWKTNTDSDLFRVKFRDLCYTVLVH